MQVAILKAPQASSPVDGGVWIESGEYQRSLGPFWYVTGYFSIRNTGLCGGQRRMDVGKPQMTSDPQLGGAGATQEPGGRGGKNLENGTFCLTRSAPR